MSMRLATRRAAIAGSLALSFLLLPAVARADCITETVTTTYYIFGVEVMRTVHSISVCDEIVAR